MQTSLNAQIVLSDERVVLRSELGINTSATDYGPTYYGDGVVYVSATAGKLTRRLKAGRRRTPDLTTLWLVKPDAGGYLASPQEFLERLEGKGNSGPAAFSADGKQAFLTQNAGGGRGRSKVARRLQIYESRQSEDGRWSDPVAVPFSDETSNDAHPALAPDGSWMAFVSDRDGGFGGLDLWGVRREGEGWGKPFNLGLGVNTGGNEGFPFIHADGTLYFATTVEGANGGVNHLDIVYSRPDGERWTDPTSLGDPFNSPADDFGLVVDPANQKGYFSSGRAGGIGADDIYSFEIIGAARSVKSSELAIQVTDAVTGGPLQGAAVTYLNTDLTSLTTALEAGVVSVDGDPLRVVGGDNYMTDIAGQGKIRTISGTYLIEVSREGYEPVQIPLVLRGAGTSLPIALSPKQACSTVRISVLDRRSLLPVAGANLTAALTEGGGVSVVESSRLTGADGTVLACLPCGEVYALNASAGGLVGEPVTYSTQEGDCGSGAPRTTLTIYLSPGVAGPGRQTVTQVTGNPLSAGTRLQLPSVFYALNASSLNPDAQHDLDELAKLMQRFGEMRVELGSHTDAIGNADFNKDLSQRRANEAKRYLVERAGIPESRIVATGYGESKLRNGCRDGVACGPAQHRENRRTEVVILDDRGRGAELSLGYVPPSATGRNGPRAITPAVPSERTQNRANVSAGAGESVYYVLAGSFPSARDAGARLSELEKLGYESARVKSLTGVPGSSVIAGEFTDVNRAAQFSRALREAHGIQATVRKAD